MSITVTNGSIGRAEVPRQRSATSALSERVRQLAALQGMFTETLDGNSRIAIINGPVGCGKTELLNTFSDQVAATGGDFLGATASRAEQAVPFGVVAHLLHSAEIDADLRARATRWVTEAQSVLMSRLLLNGSSYDVAPQTFHGMCMTLLDIVERTDGPLVIGIDDAQYADLASLRCLSFVVRRLRSARLMVVLNESLHSRRPATLSEAELPPEPMARFLKIPLLSPQGVEDVIAEHLGHTVARTLAADGYTVSGGNPMLLRGLIEDNRNTVPSRSPAFRVAGGFSQALISCLYRYEPEVLHVARRLAVLDEAPSVSVLAQLAGLDTESTAQALEILQETGLLSEGLLRHAQARAAVLSGMTAEERADLQVHTANVLFKNGSSAVTVARQIIGSDRVDTDCAFPILHEAAEQSLADGEVEFALDCLRLALQYDTDDRRRAITTAMLIGATWRTDPYAAYRRVPGLAADVRAGLLSGRRVSGTIDALLWFGRPDEATELMEYAAEEASAPLEMVTASQRGASHWLLHALYPAWAAERPAKEAASAWADGVSPELGARRRAAAMLRRNMIAGPGATAVAEARQALRQFTLLDETMPVLLVSVHTLLYAEHLHEAREWADTLAAAARRQSAIVWEALFCAVRAEILLRQGKPKSAEEQVERALTMLPARHWGIALAIPVSTALLASALTGSDSPLIREAQSAIPSAVFETPFGMRLLRARGQRSLANGQAAAALDDFLAVGAIAGQWQMDNPVVVPWRSGAALAYIRLGDPDRARTLASEELRRCGPGHPRAYAGALRTLAACSPVGEGLKLLGKAVEALQTCSAPLELSFALHDLGWSLQEQGQYSKGRLMLRRARHMAEESGARIPARTTGPAAEEQLPSAESAAQRTDGGLQTLSDAEMRVAHLAVGGHSNRQIAGQLFVTVSTVEQHLTRIYRKLSIKRRTDLAFAIQLAERSERAPTAP